MTDFERRSIISGIGQSDVGRRLGRTGLDLTVEACLAAIADAGLDTTDIGAFTARLATGHAVEVSRQSARALRRAIDG